MDRRAFVQNVSRSVALTSVARFLPGCHFPKRKKPNVIIIITDDQGWGDIRINGNPDVNTPVLDRLSTESVSFERFYVCPVCAPTRASLLTGNYHLRTGCAWVTRGLETMRLSQITMPDVFKVSGYKTGYFGKWHNGSAYPYHPLGRGFEHFFGFCAGHWNNYFNTSLEENGLTVQTKGYITDVLTDNAIRFLKNVKHQPFFCYIAYNTPHSPFQVPDWYFDKYRALGFNEKDSCVYGMVENLDDNIGRILNTLNDLSLSENTIVVFLTDNGPNGERYNGNMRGSKASVHEGGIRVPLYIRWPEKLPEGKKVSKITAHIDIFPTLLELCGISLPAEAKIDGRSLVPLINDSSDWPDRFIFTHQTRRGEVKPHPCSVRSEKYRLVNEGDAWTLFDMEKDPGETADILAKETETARLMKEAYERWYNEVTELPVTRLPIPVGYDEMKIVNLFAPESYFEGGVHYEGRMGYANDWLTGWNSKHDRIWWDIAVVHEGSYSVSLLYTCTSGNEGCRIALDVQNQHMDALVPEAYDPEPIPSPDRVPRGEIYEKVWGNLCTGTVRLTPGRSRLELRLIEKMGEGGIDLKGVKVEKIMGSSKMFFSWKM